MDQIHEMRSFSFQQDLHDDFVTELLCSTGVNKEDQAFKSAFFDQQEGACFYVENKRTPDLSMLSVINEDGLEHVPFQNCEQKM